MRNSSFKRKQERLSGRESIESPRGYNSMSHLQSFHNYSCSKVGQSYDKNWHSKHKLPPTSNSRVFPSKVKSLEMKFKSPKARESSKLEQNPETDQSMLDQMTGNKIFTTSAKRSLVYKSPSLPVLGGSKHLYQYSNGRSIKIEDINSPNKE
jgi:hypothetical protein